MEVVVVPMSDFHFDSATNSPYRTAPSSPKRFGDFYGYYTSAPTSPSQAAAIYNHFSNHTSSSVIAFDWEEKPGTPKPHDHEEEEDPFDFALGFSGQLDAVGSVTAAADELFEEGKIRPLKPPPRLQHVSPPSLSKEKNAAASPRSPKSPKSKPFWSPRHKSGKQDDFDPFTRAMEETTRGRERLQLPTNGGSLGSRRAARSLSPMRPATVDFNKSSTNPNTSTPTSSNGNKSGGSKKWRLKDLFLFRSASEGRATGCASKDPLRKYTALSPTSSLLLSGKGSRDDSKSLSFRSTDSGGTGSSRRGVSAHEIHYTANRAVSEEMKRKTFLPYRHGLFGCLAFNPAINGITKGFGTLTRRRSRFHDGF